MIKLSKQKLLPYREQYRQKKTPSPLLPFRLPPSMVGSGWADHSVLVNVTCRCHFQEFSVVFAVLMFIIIQCSNQTGECLPNKVIMSVYGNPPKQDTNFEQIPSGRGKQVLDFAWVTSRRIQRFFQVLWRRIFNVFASLTMLHVRYCTEAKLVNYQLDFLLLTLM